MNSNAEIFVPTDIGMNDRARDTATQIEDTERQARALRRLLRSFSSTNSYGLVLLMIVVTYVLAASLSGRWAATILLFTQIATVWQALRISQARRVFRLVATGLFVLAATAQSVRTCSSASSRSRRPAMATSSQPAIPARAWQCSRPLRASYSW